VRVVNRSYDCGKGSDGAWMSRQAMFCDCATVFEHDLPTCEMLRMLSRHVIEINKISQDKPIFTSYSF
jgi:hypothetical protein